MLKNILFAGFLSAISSASIALPMTMTGGFSLDEHPSGGNSASVNTGTNQVTFSPNTVTTTGATGIFTNGLTGTISNFTYNETTGALSIPNLFNVGTYTFDLNTITALGEFTNAVILEGYGTISDSSNTYTDTAFFWQFSTSGNGSWSASVVPAPGVIALLSIGLLGLAAMRRKETAKLDSNL